MQITHVSKCNAIFLHKRENTDKMNKFFKSLTSDFCVRAVLPLNITTDQDYKRPAADDFKTEAAGRIGALVYTAILPQ